MTRIKYLPIFVLFLLFVLFPTSKAEAAAYIKFDPASITATVNSEFNIPLKVGTDGKNVMSATIYLDFDSSKIEYISASNGSLFNDEDLIIAQSTGRIEIKYNKFTSYTSAPAKENADLITLKFKAKAGSGNSSVSMFCQSGTPTTKMTSYPDYQNILTCNNLNSLDLTFSQEQSPTQAITPTPTQATTGDSTANRRPDCIELSINPTSGYKTGKPITFTCRGTDADGYIKQGMFIFNQSDSKTENAASNASTISYVFKNAGNYTVICGVKDNADEWSNESAICTKTISVSFAPTATSKPIANSKMSPTTNPTETEAIPTATYYPVDVDSLYETTENTEAENVQDNLQEDEKTNESQFPKMLLLALAGAFILTVISILIIRRRRSINEPPINPPVMPPGNYPSPNQPQIY